MNMSLKWTITNIYLMYVFLKKIKGIYLLRELKAIIDCDKGMLITPDTKILLYIRGEQVPSNAEIPITVPLNYCDIDEGLITCQRFLNGVEIPAGICKVHNGQTTVLSINLDNEEKFLIWLTLKFVHGKQNYIHSILKQTISKLTQ